MLHREGYADHISGHLSCRLEDNSFLFTPRLFAWDEIRAGDIVHTDMEGQLIEGVWTVTVAAEMHLAIYRARPDVRFVVHGHPEYGSLWASVGELPGCYDQTSVFGLADDEIAQLCTYEHVESPERARSAAAALGQAGVLLLANHGTVVVGEDAPSAHRRAVQFEHRSKVSWRHRIAGTAVSFPADVAESLKRVWPYSDGSLFAAAARLELRLDPLVLSDEPSC
jgi:L-fuculose-phosphate aldolase